MELPATDKPRALVVDDDTGARLSIRTVLLRSNFDVIDVARADVALATVREHVGDFAIAVLDLKLERASGVDLLRDIKEVDPMIEVVMITGFETVEAAKRALRLGACDFLNKPFEVPALAAAAAQALRLYQSSRSAARREAELDQIAAEMGPAGLEFLRLQRGTVHDTRNLLCVVRAHFHHVATVLNGHTSLNSEEVLSLRGHIGLIGRQLEGVVNLLDHEARTSRAAEGLEDITDIQTVLSDLQMSVQRHPDAKLCEYTSAVADPTVRLQISATEVAQLLLNLMLNGAQSSPGRVRVSVTVGAPGPLPNDFDSTRGYAGMKSFGLTEFQGDRPLVRVAVKDDGGGIPGDVLNRLTTAQVTTKVRGNGVGMVVISEIVNRARGLLTIRSTPGLGTEVEILLPAREAKSASS